MNTNSQTIISKQAVKGLEQIKDRILNLERNDYYRPIQGDGVTSNPPTQPEITAILGDPSEFSSEMVGLIIDSTNSRNWIVFSDKTDWHYVQVDTTGGSGSSPFEQTLDDLGNMTAIRRVLRSGGIDALGVQAVDLQYTRSDTYQAATGDNSITGGGVSNTASGSYSGVLSGSENEASASGSFIGGGDSNVASGINSAIGGGYSNDATDREATVGGGSRNNATGSRSTVAGGIFNTASGLQSTVGGGVSNNAIATQATVAGGSSNDANNIAATVGGGLDNTSSGDYATVAGGNLNTASGDYSTIEGGYNNTASGESSTVNGGDANVASGDRSVAGGTQSRATHQGSWVQSDSVLENATSAANNEALLQFTGGIRLVTATDGSGNPTKTVTVSTDGIIEYTSATEVALQRAELGIASTASGSFTTTDAKTVTVVNGIITSIV